jgi:hypothetical protein
MPSSFPNDENDSDDIKIYRLKDIDYFGYIAIFKFD